MPFAVLGRAALVRRALSLAGDVVLVLGTMVLTGCQGADLATHRIGEGLTQTQVPHGTSPGDRVVLGAQTPVLPRTSDQVALASVQDLASGSSPGPCARGMVLVEGDYCPDVRLSCKRYLDPKGRYEQFRCAEYGPSECISKQRRHLRFCIDRTEFAEAGESLPANHMSFSHGEKACAREGKRLCRESEWNFACEGEEIRPYPYGFARDASACNADRLDVVSPEGKLRDLRAPGGAFTRCQSPFGVMDMAGNLEEFVAMDGPGPARPAMKGAYWQPSRNFCRAAQTAHDRYYRGTETGFRCCSDPAAPE